MTVEATTDGAPVDEDVIPCENPATGEQFDEVAVAGEEEVDRAVERAREAQRHWSRLPAEERADYLLEARDVILDHRRELRDLLVRESGKVPFDALTELFITFDTLGWYANNGPDLLEDERPKLHLAKHKKLTIHHDPVGLVVNVSPWNFPLELALNPVVPALMAGNAAIIKPSEWTPKTAMEVVDLVNRTGLPEGLLQVVPGYGETGAALVEEADAVSFTGSVPTGKKVAQQAAGNLVSTTLELGSKDPSVVLDDANIDRAVAGNVWGAFFNAGQVCMSIERCYVHESIYDEFVERVVQKTRQLRVGVPGEGEVDVGALTFPPQLETIQNHVDDAVEQGARLLVGGEPARIEGGRFFEPTVLVDVDHDMDIMRDETFGPVLPIKKVQSVGEAVRLANDSPYGLNASVWSGDSQRAHRIADQIESGNVCINDVIVSYGVQEAPYGGIKDSGIGRRHGRWELEEFTQTKSVVEDRLGLNAEPQWYPYSERVLNAFDRAFGTIFREGVTDKIKGLFS